MAEFQAKKLNANEINNGQKWEYGQSPSTETLNAPIEGCLYLQERSIKTEKELQNIKSVLLGNNQYVEIKTEDAYKSRITANGANIFDDQYARVTNIQGDTVSTESGLKHAHFESVKSTGRNLVNFYEIAQNVVNQSTNSEIVTFDGKRCLKFLDIGNASIQTILPSGIIHGLRFKAYIDGWFASFASCKLSNGTNQYFGISEAEWNKWVEFSRYFNDDRTIESFTFYAYNYQNNAPVYIDLDSVMFERSGTPTDYKPYKESIYKLPVPVELPKYDSVLPQEGKIIRATDTVTINGTTAKVAKSVDLGDWQLYTYTPNSNLSCVYGSQIVPMGWGSDTPANSVGFSKGVYLTNTNYVTIGVWFHKVDFLAETGVDTSNATAINEYLSNNPLIIERQLQNTNTLPLECPQYYTAWNNGTETVIQGETDNSEFGAMPTITQSYLGKVGE